MENTIKEDKKNIFKFEIINYNTIYKDIISFFITISLLFYINIFYKPVINLDLQIKIFFEILFYGIIFTYLFFLINKYLLSRISDNNIKNKYNIKLLFLSLFAFFFFMVIEIYEYKSKYKREYKSEPYINYVNDRISYQYSNYYEHYLKSNTNRTFIEYLSIRNINTGPIFYLNSLSYSEGISFVNFKNNHQREEGEVIRAYLKYKYLNIN